MGTKSIFKLFFLIFLATIFTLITVSAWNPPSQLPPRGNVPQPINVGPREQIKAGTIGAYYFKVLGWDAVYGSIDTGGVNRPFHLIGTYHGWDPYGVYIAGYNFYNNSAISQAKKVYVGGGKTERMTIDLATGNVGIGTTGPTYKLDVVGDVRWTGILQGGSVPWERLTFFPADCPSGQYVYGIGTTLKCAPLPATGASVSFDVWVGDNSNYCKDGRKCCCSVTVPDGYTIIYAQKGVDVDDHLVPALGHYCAYPSVIYFKQTGGDIAPSYTHFVPCEAIKEYFGKTGPLTISVCVDVPRDPNRWVHGSCGLFVIAIKVK